MSTRIHLPSQPSASIYSHNSENQEHEQFFLIDLQNWREEKRNTPEYASRLEAERKIKNCYDSRSDELFLNGLGLTSIPSAIGFLNSLLVINLEENRLTYLPPEIFDLENLKVLKLYHNQLQSLSEEISRLQKLEELDVEHNQLTSLPSEICNLLSLKILNLSENRLVSLPEGIRRLQHLQQISMNYNPLAVPVELVQMPAGCRISVIGCSTDPGLKALFGQRRLEMIYHAPTWPIR